ncbi:MAG: MogA/MoaB family molybdenum cofactor biosynthesis protein [Nitrospirae bacterium]|nr:MogA/MoaB family molybdenum cofactor biosynthesis protein [Nitrospirota bacterium]
MGHVEHRAQGPREIACFVVTCSDTRTPADDRSGDTIRALLKSHDHRVTGSVVVRDDPEAITEVLERVAGDRETQAILLTGGTGLSRRDSTFEAVDRLLEKRIDGFGELFRWLSFQEIGPAAMLSRATAGLYRGTIVFSLPGSEGAVRLAMERLILPELGHAVWLAGR